MSLKLRCLKCLFILLGALQAHSQAPGYMGKRFALSYGFYFSPAILGSNAQGNTMFGKAESKSESGHFAFNTQHQLGIEYVLKNHLSIGFSTTYYRTMFDNSIRVSSNLGYPTGNYDISGLNYSLYFKIYRKQSLAPYGKYFLFGPTLNTTKSTYSNTYMKVTNTNTPFDNNFGLLEQKYKRVDLVIGWGKSRILYNKLVVDYGFNLQFIGTINAVFGPESPDILELSFDFIHYQTALNYIENTTRLRNREVNKFNVFIKLGVLLF